MRERVLKAGEGKQKAALGRLFLVNRLQSAIAAQSQCAEVAVFPERKSTLRVCSRGLRRCGRWQTTISSARQNHLATWSIDLPVTILVLF